MSIRDGLIAQARWAEDGEFDGRPVLSLGGMAMVTIPGLHLRADDIDKRVERSCGIAVDEVIFLSKHRAASGRPSLTVHPIGNFGRAEFGGREGELVPAAPELMTSLLRALRSRAEGLGFEVTFEVTHHGPYLEAPTLFIEIGSSEVAWGDKSAAAVIASALLGVEIGNGPRAIGIGGGHYAPRFTEVALAKRVSFGHMLPGYAMDLGDEASLRSRIAMALDRSGASLAYVHRRSMKRSEAAAACRLVEGLGAEVIDSSALQDL